MAIQINANVETADGFIVQPFCYLYIQIYNPNLSNCIVQYFKSEADFIAGKNALNVPSLVNGFNAEITAEEFWGTELAMVFHNKTIALIEQVLGEGTCQIVQL